jgi:hypothetical protein
MRPDRANLSASAFVSTGIFGMATSMSSADNASGKKMQFHGFVLWRFEGNKIAERWAAVTSPAEGVSWTAEQAPRSPEERAS